jgi:hypothetical protein
MHHLGSSVLMLSLLFPSLDSLHHLRSFNGLLVARVSHLFSLKLRA